MSLPTIVFIHGQYLTPRCWDAWVSRYEARGATCFAPAWPGRYGAVDLLRRVARDGHLARLRLSEIVDEYYKLLFRIEDRVVFVGHGAGGLIAQLLLQKGLASGAVAICPLPPAGVRPARWMLARANWPLLAPWPGSARPIRLGRRRFGAAFAAHHPPARRAELHAARIVPESRQVARDLIGPPARIDFAKAQAPLLLLAAGRDRVVPESVVRATYQRYAIAREAPVVNGTVEFECYPDRSHGLLDQPGWEVVADDVHDWISTRIAADPGDANDA